MTTHRTLTDGVFDPPHVGHVAYLRAAAALGYPVVVRVAPDADVKKKGRQPFQIQQERGKFFESLSMVSEVCYYDTLVEAILAVAPAYLVKGMCWHGKLPADVVAACEACGTAIVYTSTPSRSSTERLAAA